MSQFSTKEQKNEKDLSWIKVIIWCLAVPAGLALLGGIMCCILCCWARSIRKRLALRDLKSGTGEKNAVKLAKLLELSKVEDSENNQTVDTTGK